jgi:hypothetical protein
MYQSYDISIFRYIVELINLSKVRYKIIIDKLLDDIATSIISSVYETIDFLILFTNNANSKQNQNNCLVD